MPNEKSDDLNEGDSARAASAHTHFISKIFVMPPPNHQVYALVGRISATWAQFEHMLDAMIWAMFPEVPQRQIACITSQIMGHRPRYAVLVALLTEQGFPQTLVSRTNKLNGEAESLANKRNRSVHDAWMVAAGSHETYQYKAMPKGDLKFGLHPHDTAQLEMFLAELDEYFARVVILSSDIWIARRVMKGLPV